MQPEMSKQPDRLNCYLPTRTDDANSLDDLIQTLTESLIHRLDDISGSEILHRLEDIPDADLLGETMLLREEIQRLRNRLCQM
jgi:hypothetical protein